MLFRSNVQGTHFYVLAGDLEKPVSVWAGDGIPPNQSKPVPTGSVFPSDARAGDYFLRSDYIPPILFRREEHRWTRAEVDWRTTWLPANTTLVSFINNTDTTKLTDGTVVNQQVNLRDAVKPRLDPDII